MAKDIPQGLMNYLEDLSQEMQKIRDQETKNEIRNLGKQLFTLRIAKALVYKHIQPAKKNLLEITKDDDFASFPFTKDIESYITNFDDLMTHSTVETKLLSDTILNLLEIIDKLFSDLEVNSLSEVEETSKSKKQRKKKTKEDEDELDVPPVNPFEDENPFEEDEEEEVFVDKLYQCDDCFEVKEASYQGGCKHCGSKTVQVVSTRR